MSLKEIIEVYYKPIESLLEKASGLTYQALFLEPDIEGMKNLKLTIEHHYEIRSMYIMGILERAHLCSLTSLARSSRWLASAEQLEKSKNYLGYSAAIRGFLESSADAFDLMYYLPKEINRMAMFAYVALYYPEVAGARNVGLADIENKLIHYMFAGTIPKNSTALPHHAKKTTADYIKKIQDFGVPEAKKLYAECCELTHPASESVMCFLNSNNNSYKFNPNRDTELINNFNARHDQTISLLAQYSLNPALITMAILSRIIPYYNSLPNNMMFSIGNGSVEKNLTSLDNFIVHFNAGNCDIDKIYENMVALN